MTLSPHAETLARVRERWETMFPFKAKGVTLNASEAPVLAEGLGLVTKVYRYFADPALKTDRDDVLVVPTARLHEAEAVLDALAATLS